MRKRVALVTSVSISLLIAACSSSSSHGTAPTVSALNLSPTDLKVGSANTVTGTMQFADPDGDLVEIDSEVHVGAQTQTLPATQLAGVSGQTVGTLQLTVLVQPTAAGQIDFFVWVTDKQGNSSNRLTTVFQAK